MSTPLVGDLLQRWPQLPALQKASEKTLRKFFAEHNCRSEERIQQRLDEIGKAVPATTDAALLKTGDICIHLTVQVLVVLRAGIAEFDRQIEAVYQSHPDGFLMASLPGAGPVLEPRLIAALGTNRERFESASSMACCFGIAPVTVSSGNSHSVHWRWACSKFVRQTFHEWANCSLRSCGWAKEHYDKQRLKGKGHHASIRSVAFKWIRILFRCGGIACLTPSNSIWRRSESTAPARPRRPRSLPIPHQCFPGFSGKAVEGFRNSPKFPVDGLTQKSYGRGSVRYGKH